MTKSLTGIAALAAASLLASTIAAFASMPATLNHDSDVYGGPAFATPIVNSVDDGQTVDVTTCVGSWCKLHIPGPDGWVRKHFLDFGSVTPPTPPAPTPPLPYGPDTCKSGFVWRDAIPGDHVCVTPGSRSTAAAENASAGAHVNPAGTYGPNTCVAGYVWREAYTGDVVCVVPARRDAVHQENAEGPSHRVMP